MMLRQSSQAKRANKENVPPKPKKRKGPAAPKSVSSGKKVRLEPPTAALSQLTLMDLPEEIHFLLLKYLDVRSLKKLAMTNHHLHEMINGSYLLSVNLPLLREGAFRKELKENITIEKKPLLRIERKKPMTYNHYFWRYENNKDLMDLQMDLHSLQSVRELDFGKRNPVNWTALATAERADLTRTWTHMVSLDQFILNKLSGLGALQNLSRLDVIIPEDSFARYLWEEIIPKVKLLSLKLTVVEGSPYSAQYLQLYPFLEKLVSVSRTVEFSLEVLNTSKAVMKWPKTFRNDVIEELHVSAPCAFDLQLQMKKLKAVSLTMSRSGQFPCSYPRSRTSDRGLHRNGLCVVNLGTLHGACPQLTTFNGIHIGSMAQAFPQWSSRVKKVFYDNYLLEGGDMEFKAWDKARWFKKKPEV